MYYCVLFLCLWAVMFNLWVWFDSCRNATLFQIFFAVMNVTGITAILFLIIYFLV